MVSLSPRSATRANQAPQTLAAFDKSWTLVTLGNNLQIIHVPLQGDERFHLLSLVGVGSRHEAAAQSGISHFLEHMMFRGSRLYPDYQALAEAFEKLGGEWNASTTEEYTEYYYQGIARHAPEAIRLFADFLENPCLSDIEIEREVIMREIEGETNEFSESTDLAYHVASCVWPGSTLAQPIVGTADSLRHIDAAALRLFFSKHYIPRNMVICAVGGGPTETILPLLQQHFSSFRGENATNRHPRVKTPEAFVGPSCRLVRNTDNQYHLQLSFLTPGGFDTSRPRLLALARVLSDGFASRMARRLRDELGLVYEFNADVDFRVDVGTFDITASVGLQSAEPFLREILAILADLKVNGPTPSEMERVTSRTLVDVELLPSAPASIAFDLAWAALNHQKSSLKTRHQTAAKLSVDTLRKCAQETFLPGKASLVLLGPEDDALRARLLNAMIHGF